MPTNSVQDAVPRDVAFELTVQTAPPVKQTPGSAAERASQASLVDAITRAFRAEYPDGWPTYAPRTDLELVIRYERGVRRSDSANIIGGIADALERLKVYSSDSQLRQIAYAESPSHDSIDRYTIAVRRVG